MRAYINAAAAAASIPKHITSFSNTGGGAGIGTFCFVFFFAGGGGSLRI